MLEASHDGQVDRADSRWALATEQPSGYRLSARAERRGPTCRNVAARTALLPGPSALTNKALNRVKSRRSLAEVAPHGTVVRLHPRPPAATSAFAHAIWALRRVAPQTSTTPPSTNDDL